MANEFSLCPECGSKNIKWLLNKKWVCPDCNFTLYNNVAASVTLIIQDTDGSIIFEKRAKEPKAGFLTMPGGFIDLDETAEQACHRECLEETGIEPDSIKYTGSFPNTYEYKNIIYKTCDLFFTAQFSIPNSKDTKIIDLMQRQESEVQEFVSIKINTPADIENARIAFDSHKKALKAWLQNKNC